MIKIYYFKKRKNIGDYYGHWLLKKMLPNERIIYSTSPDIICCGSIIDHKIPENTLCWGCGIHKTKKLFPPKPYTWDKNAYYAVRGKLTAKILNLKNIALGDTGLLAPIFLKPKSKKKYKFGIIAHYEDLKRFTNKFSKLCPVISVTSNDLESFIEQINQCEFIFSSSLHGIIFSHAFGIPAIHVECRKLESKDNFKFKDYFSVLDVPYVKETVNNNLSFVNKYLDKPKKYLPSSRCIKKIQKDLLSSFPYKTKVRLSH